tara:strand:+ start:943 stop:1557 length:615 start_codon:yes stop_codon:yes gene_type:complete
MKDKDTKGLFKRLFGGKSKPVIPSNARFFLADLLGIDKTFTEDDLTTDEFDFLKNLVKEKYVEGEDDYSEYFKEGGKLVDWSLYGNQDSDGTYTLDQVRNAEGLMDLVKKSYNPEVSLATTLGQFGLKTNDKGELIAFDNYDFNYFSEMTENMTRTDALKGFFQQLLGGNPYKAMGIVAGKLGTDERDKAGNPVRINLGNLLDF